MTTRRLSNSSPQPPPLISRTVPAASQPTTGTLNIHISDFSDASSDSNSESQYSEDDIPSPQSRDSVSRSRTGSSSSSDFEEEGSNSEPSEKSGQSLRSSSSSSDSTAAQKPRRKESRSRSRNLRPSASANVRVKNSQKRSQVRKKRRSSPPLHYKNYYHNHHLRVDKFSFAKIIRDWILKMTIFFSKHHKEICLGFFILATGLAGLRTGPLKTRTVPVPSPFYEPDEIQGILDDHYHGEFLDIYRRVLPYTPTFILYYAPWDSESVEAKPEFLRVAKHFHSTRPGIINFYAINCWWPDGQCRQNFNGISHYPIFVVHLASQYGHIYSGPIRAEMIIRFLNSALMPFTRLDSEEELIRFRARHDAVMLASFNFSAPNTEPAYDTYRQMALKSLESDPFSQIGYGLFLKPELGDKYFLSTSNSISLVLFNEIHTAKWIGTYKEKGLKGPVGQVTEWVAERASKPPITWTYGVRNGYSNQPVGLGPYNLYQELDRGPIFLLVTRRYFPSGFSPFYNQVKEVALDYFNCNKSGNVTKLRRKTHLLGTEWMKLWETITDICRKSKPLSHNCQLMWDQFQHWQQRKGVFRKESLAHYEAVSQALGFTGFSCESARPFRFLAVDPEQIPHFTKLALGLHVDGNTRNGTTQGKMDADYQDPQAFIIDSKNELLLPFNSFNISDLAIAVYAFTKQVESGDLHFPSSQLRNEKKPGELANTETTSPNYTIRNFNSAELLEVLQHEGPNEPALLLMYTTNYMGYCGVSLAQFVRLSKFLEKYQINIRLGKINTFKNSLPAELTPEKIPTFVFYPGRRRADSRLFPNGQEINTQTLLRFILSELEPEERIRLSRQGTSKLHRPTESPDSDRKRLDAANSAALLQQIDSILQKMRTDPSLKQMHRDLTSSDLKIDTTPNAVRNWKYELLDHLRSMKVALDVDNYN